MSCHIPKSDLETMQRQGCFYSANGAVHCGELKDPVNYILQDANTMQLQRPVVREGFNMPPGTPVGRPIAATGTQPVAPPVGDELASQYMTMTDSIKQYGGGVVEGFAEKGKKSVGPAPAPKTRAPPPKDSRR